MTVVLNKGNIEYTITERGTIKKTKSGTTYDNVTNTKNQRGRDLAKSLVRRGYDIQGTFEGGNDFLIEHK